MMHRGKTFLELFEEAKKGDKTAIDALEALAIGPPSNTDALTTLGTCYYSGYGVAQDYKKAHEIYDKAAKAGCDMAKYSLGHLFQYGLGVTTVAQTAAYWYYEAARGITSKTASTNKAFQQLEVLANASPPNPAVLTTLGSCYYNGYGVTQNDAKAIEFYSKAAQYNYDLAMYNLGVAFEVGRGVEKNLSVATYWYRRAKNKITTETKDINLAASRLALLASAESKEIKIPSDSAFDKQVVIDCMGTGVSFSQLALTPVQKWNSTRADKCHLMRGADLLNKKEQLDFLENKETGLVRIYIVGHCWVGCDFLVDNNKNKIHFNQLAEALKYFIKDKNVVINLIACCAGKGLKPTHEDSFAAKLHLALRELTKKDIPVVARASLVSVFIKEQKKITFMLPKLEEYKTNYDAILTRPEINETLPTQSFYLNKQPDSKVTFMLDEKKQQIRIDAYKEKLRKKTSEIRIKSINQWKSDAISNIKLIIKTTSIKEKEALLTSWLSLFNSDQSEEKIYHLMQQEFMNADSVLRSHSRSISKFFNRPTNAIVKVKKIIENGRMLFNTALYSHLSASPS
jgi:hypothetical protein